MADLPATSIREILNQAGQSLRQHSETPILDVQVLLAQYLAQPGAWVMAYPEFLVDSQRYEQIHQALMRLERGEPLPYVLGHWEFFNLDFYLTPDVLIPRPETELLVEQAIGWLKDHPQARRAIDVGTGSGCIGIALAMNVPYLYMLLTDISPLAQKVAAQNAERHGLSARLGFQQADTLDGIEGVFDLITANLPYIPSQELRQLPVFEKEPSLALDGGERGIELIDRLLNQSRSHLAPGGLLLLEIEASQGAEVCSHAQMLYPGSAVEVLKDLSGRDRCIKIQRV
ncbi:MAG: protein-(glutamine-N5) methyltransferase, release factor-specific [Chloroflexi bacterium RBG_16_54_11]|nr:MAG: protein-(glutamine-N5) methyltransferase, release factor-specific [Chloroflexi bacterium RBG_16_54_11]